jgi:hypothetical protein
VEPGKTENDERARHRELKEFTARAICRQLEVPEP